MNGFFTMQGRLQSLISAATYFAGLLPTQILTEEVGDLAFMVNNKILPLGFGIVISTASGKSLVSEWEVLISMEDLNISVIHNPTSEVTHKTLDAVAAAIAAVQGQSVQTNAPPEGRPFDYFAVTGHQRRMDAPPELHVHEIHVSGGLRLQ